MSILSRRHPARLAAVTAAATAVGVAAALAAAPSSAAPADPGSSPFTAPAFTAGRYVVVMSDQPVATYAGGVAGYTPTKPKAGAKVQVKSADATRYAAYLTARQTNVARAAGVTPSVRYSTTLSGFAATLTADQAREIAAQPGVRLVAKDTLHKATDDRNSIEQLKIRGGLWPTVGGPSSAGKGVVVGVIDTGIWPENPSFAGAALGTKPATAADPYLPYRSGGTTVMAKADGSTFTGICQTGEQFTTANCNTKVIAARYFGAAWLAANPPSVRADFVSPRDGGGHGSHTASTAAGNNNVAASVDGIDFGRISGVAPGARIAVYKGLWESTEEARSGGFTSDLVSAIDAAVADGVDVINYSIGSSSESAASDPTQLAFLSAASAGIFVSASAGNSGPGAATMDNTAPWLSTVAASSIAPYTATVTLGNGRTFVGISTSVDEPLKNKRLVLARAVRNGDATAADATLCIAGTLDPAKTAGKVVVCERGINGRLEKSTEVDRAGGAGMLLVNPTGNSLDADVHFVPTVHLDVDAYPTVKTYAGRSNATVTFTPGNTTSIPSPAYPQVAGFSSRGPSLASGGDILKPDIAAPGVSILAAVAPPSNHGRDYDFYSGTSMAAPHIAGLAAIYFGVHPTWTPMMVKSAMMTTAGDTVGTTDPFAQGAGVVTPTRMLNPGLVYNAGDADWLGYLAGIGEVDDTGVAPIDPSNYNNPSIAIGQLLAPQTVTRKVTATTAGLYRATISVPGVTATVSPSILNFDSAGQTKTFTVKFTRTTAAFDVASKGTLTWTGGGTTVRSPIAVTPKAVAAPAQVAGSGASGSKAFTVTPGVTGSFPVTARGLAENTRSTGTLNVGQSIQSALTVAEDTEAARFTLDSENDAADLDLVVYRVEGGVGTQVGVSASGAADEEVVLRSPAAGTYVAVLQGYANAPGASTSPFTFTKGAVTTADSLGSFAVSPTSPTTTAGRPITLTASWSGLTAGTPYLGWIEYLDGSGTVVTVN
ncbi:S8 family peptidase [Jatrophihabitans sp. YIM 134969]